MRASKKVRLSRPLPLAGNFGALTTRGPGQIKIDYSNTVSGQGSILLETPASLPIKKTANRSYGSAEIIREQAC